MYDLQVAAYDYAGMITQATKKANKEWKHKDQTKVPALVFRDLKGKGATYMWLAGTPIEQIQLLCGYADRSST